MHRNNSRYRHKYRLIRLSHPRIHCCIHIVLINNIPISIPQPRSRNFPFLLPLPLLTIIIMQSQLQLLHTSLMQPHSLHLTNLHNLYPKNQFNKLIITLQFLRWHPLLTINQRSPHNLLFLCWYYWDRPLICTHELFELPVWGSNYHCYCVIVSGVGSMNRGRGTWSHRLFVIWVRVVHIHIWGMILLSFFIRLIWNLWLDGLIVLFWGLGWFCCNHGFALVLHLKWPEIIKFHQFDSEKFVLLDNFNQIFRGKCQ